ncbi:MAG: VPLPA-CTERM sorting domain-containing protein [Pseudomonadota bacterium]|nr:VPLPA-CTERM sorting domain-containing protein [Pseudomonadota bacterium]
MKVSLKQIVAASMLMAASAGAFADLAVPAGYQNSATAPQGLTTDTDMDGGLVFHLFNTGETTYSVSYYLGVDLSEVTASQMDDNGLTLTWTIDPALYASANLAQMQWGLVAGDNGNQNTAGSTSLLSTVNLAGGSISNLTNSGIIIAADLVDNAYDGANSDADPADVNTIAGTLEDARAQLGDSFGTLGFDWTADASDASATLAMFFYSQNGGRGQGQAEAFATQYAGVWSFNAATGALTYAVSAVPLPAAAWLLLSALGGLGAVGRRRVAA